MLWERPVRLLYEFSSKKFKSDRNGMAGLPMPPKTEEDGLVFRLFDALGGKFGPKRHVHLVQMDDLGENFRIAIFEGEGGGLAFLHRDQITEFVTAVKNRPNRGPWEFVPKHRPEHALFALEVPEWANQHVTKIAHILLSFV